ncbi:MAG: hypothetical protein ONB05_01070 [candidate division KSB1 bacterium]|nr:hypothetical protein [candidate division KSB1 bacterium]
MKTYNFILYTLTFALIGFMSCRKSENAGVAPPTDANLIVNSSFERNGAPTLQGWNSNSVDTSYVNFSNDTPSGGGSYSVKLRNGWTIQSTIWYCLMPPIGTHRYQLSVWAKAMRSNALVEAGGDVILMTKKGGVLSFRKSIHFADTVWTTGSLIDTLTTSSTDSVVVTLRGNIDQSSAGYVLFDLCRFEKLD